MGVRSLGRQRGHRRGRRGIPRVAICVSVGVVFCGQRASAEVRLLQVCERGLLDCGKGREYRRGLGYSDLARGGVRTFNEQFAGLKMSVSCVTVLQLREAAMPTVQSPHGAVFAVFSVQWGLCYEVVSQRLMGAFVCSLGRGFTPARGPHCLIRPRVRRGCGGALAARTLKPAAAPGPHRSCSTPLRGGIGR
ncbi:hypothetical protein NDU88_000919 [Pleurodeles waltl]|uniref:Uncharacterized protein n=1 Tax=Pleurodeles waltl TaxID=8319 RepID=A0AAV7VA99_PLEWA|nr:hypothetical protein NDU88_000919 [Pleurodeles waltl]